MNTCELKKLYIPQCVKGAVSISQAARLIGCTRQTVINLKKKFRDIGEKAFIHASKGRRSPNAVNAGTKKTIVEFYRDKWSGAPFSVFVDYLRQEKKIFLSYPTITKILHEAGIFSPVGYYKTPEEKRLHKPRKERPTEGELIQIDGCAHDWFMDGKKETIHGAIDDATHKIVSLYMTKNECSLGYFRMTRNIINKFGVPRAFYSDRAAEFFVTKNAKLSIEEQLAGMKKKRTQWQRLAAELKIDLIAALSPQAKGRIERLWETLQKRLPYIFRYYGIKTIEKANVFLESYIDDFNARFSVAPQLDSLSWKKKPRNINDDYLFSIREPKKLKYDGSFIFHETKFKCPVLRNKNAEICISEDLGVKCFYSGKFYDVVLDDTVSDLHGGKLTQVEQDLFSRFFLSDKHSSFAKIG
jgi:transposase